MKKISILEQVDWKKIDGLVPIIAQDASSGEVLMLAYMSYEALKETIKTKQLTLYSRSRKNLWRKGESSGNTMSVNQVSIDCDGDSLLIQVTPSGPSCHLGLKTCFSPSHVTPISFLTTLIKVILARSQQTEQNSYTCQLLSNGVNRCAQKLGEEAIETVIAAISNNYIGLVEEAADLLFHLLVLLQSCHVKFDDVLACLKHRHQIKN